jgi:murein L,D-transpeptidase YcbB/YkuD
MFPLLLFLLAFSPALQPPGQPPAPAGRQIQEQPQLQPQSPTAVSDNIRCYIEQLQELSRQAGAERKALNTQMYRFYDVRAYQPVWTSRQAAARLLKLIEQSEEEGLVPSDYHLVEIRNFYNRPPDTPFLRARADVLMTDAFMTLALHLRFGKVNPVKLDPDWNIPDGAGKSGLEYRVQNAIMSDRFDQLMQELRPQHPKYLLLKKGLARYRAIAAAGGWGTVPSGAKLERQGVSDPRIPAIRRLAVTGEYTARVPDTSRVYSADLFDAVIKFQKRHGIKIDGVIGNETVEAMNVPVRQRIDDIRVNLERYRWFISEMGPTYLMVNIAAFTIDMVENSAPRWSSRVIVGQPYRKTPVFRAEMQYIILNPQWVVPPGILEKDALPAIRKDISYLRKKQLSVVDRNGKVVSPGSVNWSAYTASSFPYRLRQTSGDHSSLGRIKFMFPNKHVVYLHDTPTKNLFEESQRTFSSGCIRVENPLDLAVIVMHDPVRWSKPNILAAINTGKTQTIFLPRRIPIFLLYLTATVDSEESVMFRKDVYERDREVLDALDRPFANRIVESCAF